MRQKVLLVNFGGPRTTAEVPEFLNALLTDDDVIRTPLPTFMQKALFKRIAKKRAPRIAHDYELIGGGSPIFADTEWLSCKLQERGYKTLTYHRYLPATHEEFLDKAQEFIDDDVIVFPLFPQFSYATTGSIARFMENRLCRRLVAKLSWVKSYSEHPAFIHSYVATIKECLIQHHLDVSDCLLFFSPHGLPASYVFDGDPYKKECEKSYRRILQSFPEAKAVIAYQSQFGRAEWIRPYTSELVESIRGWRQEYSHVVFIPLSFTSDHIETLFEVEKQYLPVVEEQGLKGIRCPALNRRSDWLDAVDKIIQEAETVTTAMLIRPKNTPCPCRGKGLVF